MAKTALEGTVYETSFSSSCNLKIYVHKATSEYQPKNIHRDMSIRCPSADEWIRKLWYVDTMEYYSLKRIHLNQF